ncbi:MAG: cellulase family glycosylhydrolase [Mycobacteriales bacterium]
MSNLRATVRRMATITVFVATLVPILAGGASAKSSAAAPRVIRLAGLDALQTSALKDLNAWTTWLADNQVQGYVGEIGWPSDDPRWGMLAKRFYNHANASGVAASTWVTGEWAGMMPLANYKWIANGTFETLASAAIMEQNPGTAANPNGVNVTGPEMGAPAAEATSTFSNTNVGSIVTSYHYDAPTTFTHLAARGVRLVRIPFRWERIQRAPYAPLDVEELARMKALVQSAAAAGLRVVLDMHNYGAYYLSDGTQGVRRAIGSAQLPAKAFADVWTKLAVAFAGDTSVHAFDLMNEPMGMPAPRNLRPATTWESASQLALNAIRATGDRRQVMVSGYNWSGMRGWSTTHPTTWITDSAKNFRYEAHQYWDAHSTGRYGTYDVELAVAKARPQS